MRKLIFIIAALLVTPALAMAVTVETVFGDYMTVQALGATPKSYDAKDIVIAGVTYPIEGGWLIFTDGTGQQVDPSAEGMYSWKYLTYSGQTLVSGTLTIDKVYRNGVLKVSESKYTRVGSYSFYAAGKARLEQGDPNVVTEVDNALSQYYCYRSSPVIFGLSKSGNYYKPAPTVTVACIVGY